MKRAAEASLEGSSREANSLEGNAEPSSAGGEWAPTAKLLPFFTRRFSAEQLKFQDNPLVFNGSLVATDGADAPCVPISASDMVSVSEWFQGVVRQRNGMAGSELQRVRVPCDVPHDVLDALVTAMYEGKIEINAGNFKPLLQLADSMMMPELLHVCEEWGKGAVQEEGATFQWLLECHRTMQCVQAGMPDLQLQLGSSLVWACLHTMDPHGFQTLNTVLTEIWGRPSGAGPQQDAVAQLDLIRSFLDQPLGGSCREAVLLLLLLKLGQQGLPLAHLLPCVAFELLHWEDAKGLHLMEFQKPLASLEDSLQLHRELLREALLTGSPEGSYSRQAVNYSSCRHVACFLAAGRVLEIEDQIGVKQVGGLWTGSAEVRVRLQQLDDGIHFTVSNTDAHVIRGWRSFMYCFSSKGVVVETASLQAQPAARQHQGHLWDYDEYHGNHGNHDQYTAFWMPAAVSRLMHDAAVRRVVGLFVLPECRSQ